MIELLTWIVIAQGVALVLVCIEVVWQRLERPQMRRTLTEHQRTLDEHARDLAAKHETLDALIEINAIRRSGS